MTKKVQPRSFTCPICESVSYNPNDVREGYCGNCHAFTLWCKFPKCENHGAAVIGSVAVCEPHLHEVQERNRANKKKRWEREA